MISSGFLTGGGSALTKEFAIRHEKPRPHLDMKNTSIEEAAGLLNLRIREHGLKVLNVAGPRAGRDAGIYSATTILETAFNEEKHRR